MGTDSEQIWHEVARMSKHLDRREAQSGHPHAKHLSKSNSATPQHAVHHTDSLKNDGAAINNLNLLFAVEWTKWFGWRGGKLRDDFRHSSWLCSFTSKQSWMISSLFKTIYHLMCVWSFFGVIKGIMDFYVHKLNAETARLPNKVSAKVTN